MLTLFVFRVSARLAARDLKKLEDTKLEDTKLVDTSFFLFFGEMDRRLMREKRKSAPEAPGN